MRKVVVEYFASLAGALVVGGAACLFGVFVLGWPGRASGVWGAATFSAIAIAVLCFAVAIGAGEPVYRLARRGHPEWGSRARKQIWKGAFLGAPAVIALLSLMEMDWMSIMGASRGSAIARVFFVVIGLVQYAVTLPVRFFVDVLHIPAEILMIVAIPVGALLVAHCSRPESLSTPVPPSDAEAGDNVPTDDTLTSARSGRG